VTFRRIHVAALFVFIAGMAGFQRDFSHLHLSVGGFPVYVTELLMCLLLILIALNRKRSIHRRGDLFVLLLVMAFVAYGIMQLLRGIPLYGMQAIRDSATFYYALWTLIGYFSIRRLADAAVFRNALLLGICIAAVRTALQLATGNVLVQRELDVVRAGEITGAAFATVALAMIVIEWRRKGTTPATVVGLMASTFVIFFAAHRSSLVALAAMAAVYVVAGFGRDVLRTALQPRLLAGAALLVVGAATALAASEELQEDALRTAGKYTVWKNEENVEGRVERWKTGMELMMHEDPMLGVGLGTPAPIFYDWKGERTHPHNSFVSVGVWTGLVGMGLLFLSILALYGRVIGTIRSLPNGEARDYGLVFLLAHASFGAFAVFNVVLEGPHMGAPFWLFGGLALSATGFLGRPPFPEPARSHA